MGNQKKREFLYFVDLFNSKMHIKQKVIKWGEGHG
jgi:hypothetical protein